MVGRVTESDSAPASEPAASGSAAEKSEEFFSAGGPETAQVLHLVTEAAPEGDEAPAVGSPAKIMRVGSMVKQLLDEVRQAPLDDSARDQLAGIYQRSVDELKAALSPDLAEELDRLAPDFAPGETPSEGAIRVAQAQLVGWLEGLFHGIQATLMMQQMTARQQLDGMRAQLGSVQGGGAESGGSPAGGPAGYL